MKIRTLSAAIMSLCVAFSFSGIAEARTATNTLRDGALAPSSAKLGSNYVNRAKDISIALPAGWLASESENWSRSSDGIEDYNESVNLNDSKNYASVSVYASAAGEETFADLKSDLMDSYGDDTYYTIMSEGTTTIGTDTAYFIEAKSSYSHYKEYLLIKGGWKYDITASTDTSKWKRYSSAIQASLSSVRITAVP